MSLPLTTLNPDEGTCEVAVGSLLLAAIFDGPLAATLWLRGFDLSEII